MPNVVLRAIPFWWCQDYRRCCLLSFVLNGVGVYLDLDILVFTRATAPLAFSPDVHFWATLESKNIMASVHITSFLMS